MSSPEQPQPKSQSRDVPQKGVAALARRHDRAAGELNPFLTVLAVGLIVLNLTLYIGMAAAEGTSTRHFVAQPRASVAYDGDSARWHGAN